MWKEIESIIRLAAGSWLCLGDFNCILRLDEKRNGNIIRDTELEDLNKFVSNCELSDLDASGHFFAWSNKNSIPDRRIWCKLDRVMGNEDWIKAHPNASAVFLPPGISDHSPVMVSWGRREIRRVASGTVTSGKTWKATRRMFPSVGTVLGYARICSMFSASLRL
ncbi:hypothetical protein QQ045_017311 [Rhodiola kirilowii]